MRFHHQSIESKLEMRQVQTIQKNIVTIYVFVDILKNHFFMSTLFLLLNETLNSRSTRKEHSASRQENDEKSNNNDEKSSESENDENDVENDDENSNARQKNVDADFEENKNNVDVESFKKSSEKKMKSTND
jgi:hypothetical protein